MNYHAARASVIAQLKTQGFFYALTISYWRLPFRKLYCSVRRSRDLLSSGMCSRLSVSPRPAAPGMLNKLRKMQTNAIQRSAQRPVDIKAWLTGKAQSLSGWYNSRSEFYSRLAGFDVTWKTAVRVNLFTLLVCVTAIVAMQQPVVAAVSAACSAWVVYRLNADEKKGGEQ